MVDHGHDGLLKHVVAVGDYERLVQLECCLQDRVVQPELIVLFDVREGDVAIRRAGVVGDLAPDSRS